MCKNILILDDHPLIIEGIKLMLNGYNEYKIASAFTDLDSLLSDSSSSHIDIVILDLNVKGKNSLDYFQKIKSLHDRAKFVAFTSYDTPSLKEKCKALHIEGYLLKDTIKSEFLNCLARILEGKIHYPAEELPDITIKKEELAIEEFTSLHKLSKRESNIFRLLIQGNTEKNIAKELFLSVHTVHSHNKNIKKKLKVNSVVQMVKMMYTDNFRDPIRKQL